MLNHTIRRIKIEYSHFLALSPDARKVLLSYVFFLSALPMIFVFVNAYLWRDSGDITTLILYNCANFFGLPIGFYTNGVLLKKLHIKRLYAIGALLQGFAPLMVVFSPTQNLTHLVTYGLLFGIGGGLYWGNKNYLSLKATRGANRVYYNSLENIADLTTAIIAPVIAGYLIVFGSSAGLYSLEFGYRLNVILGLGLLLISGVIVNNSNITDMSSARLTVANPSKSWRYNRIYWAIHQLTSGLNHFLPAVLILIFVGSEEVLGLVEAGTAALAAIAVYYVGRKTQIGSSSMQVLSSAVILLVVSGLTLGLGLHLGLAYWSVLLFLALAKIAQNIRSTTDYSITMNLIDKQASGESEAEQYAYICDNELSFNLGRMGGVLIFLLIAFATTQATAMQWSFLVVGILQIPGLLAIQRIIYDTSTGESTPEPDTVIPEILST